MCYSGYTRRHDLKYSGVMAPCGIFTNMDGPWPGKYHDSRIFTESGLEDRMSQSVVFNPPGEPPFHLYGDQAYGSSRHIISPFRGYALSAEENNANRIMSELRISVEWGFGIISRLFAFTEFAENQKIGLQPVGVYYRVATIFTNLYTCFNGNIVSSFFGTQPPTVESYLHRDL